MNITIEDANIRMLDELYEIEKQSFAEEAFSKEQIGYLLTDYNCISLAAKANGEIVGFIVAMFELECKQPVGHIMTIDVLPKFRRQGVGEHLMRETEALLKQKGANECRLEVRENNLAALGLYQKLGYKLVSRLENYYGKAHGLYLRKAPL
jgi:ribosomal-protein-alanine N-acetyltransferase